MAKNVYESIKSDLKKSQRKVKKAVIKTRAKNMPPHKRVLFHTALLLERVGMHSLAKKTYDLMND